MNTDIVEGNKLIAEFMGATFQRVDYYGNGDLADEIIFKDHPSQLIKGTGRAFSSFEDLRYDESFDWLMPVVEKISDIHYPDYFHKAPEEGREPFEDCAYPRTFGMRDKDGLYMVRFNANTLHSAKTLIEATWLAVVDFISWYNKGKEDERVK